jgi:hypothetical protein
VVPVPRLRTVTGATGIIPLMVVTLAACGGHGALDLASARGGSGSLPPSSPSEPSRPSATPGSPGALSPSGASAEPSPTQTRSAAQLLQAARDAYAIAPSVHVAGTAVRGSDAYIVDVRLAGPSGGTATIKTSGQTVDVTRIGNVAYVGGDLSFWRSMTGDETKARQMVGSHVRTRASDPNFASFVQFTQASTFAAVLPAPATPATVVAPTTIRGVPAIGVRDGAGSTLYLATAGPAYPLRLDGLAGGQVVFLDFSDYGAPVPLRAPHIPKLVHPGPGS